MLSTVSSVPRKVIKYVQGEWKNVSKWKMITKREIYINSSTSKDSVFSVTWYYALGYMFPNILNEQVTFIFQKFKDRQTLNPWKGNMTCSFKPRPTYPVQQCHIRKDQNPQLHHCKHLKTHRVVQCFTVCKTIPKQQWNSAHVLDQQYKKINL